MKPLRSLALGCSLGLSFLAGCAKSPWIQDKPQLAPSVRMLDTTLRSSALHRTLHVRIILPEHPIAPMPVLYLLHGAGVDYRDWTNHSPIATLAASNLVLVLPDATGSYYINESGGKHRNYEQYIVQELPQLVRTQVPGAATDRAHTAIAGISRGGFGALALGLRHPEQYGYIGDFSGAIDFPERTFRWRKPFESFTIYRAFGAPGSATRQNYNPFTLAAQLPAQNAPYIFLSCGDQDLLRKPNELFAQELTRYGIPHELHILHGKHDWHTWNEQLPFFEASLLQYFGKTQ